MTGQLRKRTHRLLAWALAVCMAVTLLPGAALAEAPARVTAFAPLDTAVREQRVPAGMAWEDLDLPETLEATGYPADSGDEAEETPLTVGGVTWEIDPENALNEGNGDYDPAGGSCCLTPVLPQGYVLEDGAALPEIYVVVGGQAETLDDSTSVYDPGDVAVINGLIEAYGLKGWMKTDKW